MICPNCHRKINESICKCGFDLRTSLNLKLLQKYYQEAKTNYPGSSNSQSMIGDVISFGKYSWRILAVEDEKMLLITDQIIAKRKFNYDSTENNWAECDLRTWLNIDFINESFTDEEKGRILITKRNLNLNYVFLLTADEVRYYFENDENRIAKYNGINTLWWISTPGNYANYVASIDSNGTVNFKGGSIRLNRGVRPTVWIKS